jgi:hypothetical protein
MPAREAKPKVESPLQKSLNAISDRLAGSSVLKDGRVTFRTSGAGGGDLHVVAEKGRIRYVTGEDRTPPLVEIIGDAKQIAGLLAGGKDARKRFLAGGFRVRGDLRYLSDLALELGLIDTPL